MQIAVRDSPLQCLRCTHPTGADGTSDSMEGTSSVALDSFSSRARLSAHHHSHQHQHQQLNNGNSQASALTLTTATGGYPPPPGCTSLFLLVFNSDSLDLLRLLRFDRPICPLHTCPTNYVPTMSRCGSRIAVVTMVTAVAAGGTSGGTHARTLVTLRGGNSQGRSAKTGRKITFSSHASLTAATSGEFAGVDFATPRRRAADGRTNQLHADNAQYQFGSPLECYLLLALSPAPSSPHPSPATSGTIALLFLLGILFALSTQHPLAPNSLLENSFYKFWVPTRYNLFSNSTESAASEPDPGSYLEGYGTVSAASTRYKQMCGDLLQTFHLLEGLDCCLALADIFEVATANHFGATH
ncbi:unnamed protein product [Schistocephalus solidus]|uniref:Uncharacterized protein n=1 Tax=Schistocephalus solidus TaxID=70667 RepID=A0A183T8D9_SCHSO|nr:unnamed protein product [Schistocephalus solidus]